MLGGRLMESSAQSISGRVVSVNVGRPREFAFQRGTATSAIWKQPVSGPVAARGVNLDGDDQADRTVHGGPDKAVYAYAAADYAFWEATLGQRLDPGTFGENLTIAELDVSHALVGERWQIGTAEFEVSQPRIPCYKLGHRMGDQRFPSRFADAERPGAYLRIAREGSLQTGDTVRVVHRPDHGLTVALVARAYHVDRSLVPRLLEVPELSESWRDWAARFLAA